MDNETNATLHFILLAALGLVAGWILQVAYRVYLHPLAKFSGPRDASISRRWQAAQVQTGFPEEVYARLHQHYNTHALRIGPNELHISDPKLYKVIYSQVNPFPKYEGFYECFNTRTVFSEVDPVLHKERRKLLNPVFSRAGVTKLEPLVFEKITEMGAKLKALGDKPINVSNMARCMTGDIITEFAFGQCAMMLHESPDDFKAGFLDAFDTASGVPYHFYYSAVQKTVSKLVPLRWIAKFNPEVEQFVRLQEFARQSFVNFTKRTKTAAHPIIFDRLQGIPDELQVKETIDILIAGSDTTAFTVTTALFQILRRPALKETLVRTLDEALGSQQPDALTTLAVLEKIELLHACVKESLRVAIPAPAALPRVVPVRPDPFVVDGKVVPAGTIVGMSAYTMHTREDIWGPDAKIFNPDRWIGEDKKGLESQLCTFSKGARQCIGINLAEAEIMMTLTFLFRNFNMELNSTEFRSKDVFTQHVLEPVLVTFSPR